MTAEEIERLLRRFLGEDRLDVNPKVRVRRAIVVLIAALVMWTAVSFLMLATISHAPCTPFAVIGPGGVPDKAATDAKMAACIGPRIPGDLVNQPIPLLGYLLIVGFGVAYAARGKRQGSADQ